MPATVDQLKTHLGLSGARPVDDEAMAAAVNAANDLVTALRADLPLAGGWPPRCDQAAVLQAARLYGRRGSVQGVAAFADAGVSLLARLDPDVRLLLQVGEFQQSVIA